jgi:hypothetical protein
VLPQPFHGELDDAREKIALYSQTYTYEELRTKSFPSHGLDVANLEVHVPAMVVALLTALWYVPQNYMDDEAFAGVFKMSRQAFEQLPGWKKTSLKKALQLY